MQVMFDFSGLSKDIPSGLKCLEAQRDTFVVYHKKSQRYYRIECEHDNRFVLSERVAAFGDWHFMMSTDDLHKLLRILGWKTKPKEQNQ